MTLTQERADIISNYIEADELRAEKLFKMEPEEAIAVINKDGLDITAIELKEYAEVAKELISMGELSEESLENVAGGLGFFTGCAIAIGAGILVGGMDRFQIW